MSTTATFVNLFSSNNKEFAIKSSAKLHNASTTAIEFCLQEVADHDNILDCWIVVYDEVYNVTEFLNEHPGGADVILEYAGRDATLAFRSTGHSKFAVKALQKFFIGVLPLHERIYRKPGGLRLSNMPESNYKLKILMSEINRLVSHATDGLDGESVRAVT